MQNEIIVESYWPKKQTNKNQKKVTSYISISRAAGNNRRKFKQTDLRLQTWNECQKWLAFQTTCQAFQAIPIETGAYITLLCRSIHTFRLLTSFFCLRFTMKRQQRLSLFFTQLKENSNWNWKSSRWSWRSQLSSKIIWLFIVINESKQWKASIL